MIFLIQKYQSDILYYLANRHLGLHNNSNLHYKTTNQVYILTINTIRTIKNPNNTYLNTHNLTTIIYYYFFSFF